ncbi:TolC family protein [Alteromonas sp. C1M14]|uniref:TolC family protein n=1 Tax=Alteromonas sp. C1M14 TaxID=2841567 RepID=UPI001C0A2473|nr:TolC family protein [Alteromonas sp. C1M14]MBU2978169.1 TolC family protein [Alteromonas sp. C1M14]
MKAKLSLIALTLAVVLSGCASHDDPHYSEQVQDNLGENVAWAEQSSDAEQASTLLQLLPLPEVQTLIDEALRNNPGLQQTFITLKQSRISETLANADRLPDASLSFTGDKSKNTDTQYTTSVDVSWEVDVWNKIGNSVSAAEFATQSYGATFQYAQATLAASVMQAYVDIIAEQKILQIEKNKLVALENSELVILQRYRAGLGSLDDLDTARTSSASTKASIAEYENNLANGVRALAVLLGRTSLTVDDLYVDADFPAVVQPLASLPNQDLARRPDLIAAYYDIKSNESSELVAYKNLLPSLSISGSISDSGDTPALSLLKDPVWTLLGGITAPLFQGGTLRANLASAELDTLNSWWAYQETLLTAVQEVQATLDLENSYQVRQQYIQQAYENAKRSQDNYSSQYRQGLADVLDFLSVTQTTYSLEAQLVELQRNQLSNRIDLGLALGLGVSS